MSEYILLMQEDNHAWSQMSEERQQELLKLYFAWVDGLKASKILLGGAPISDGGTQLEEVDGEITQSPYDDAKEVVTGYFIVAAESMETAVEIAKGCPALGHGESVVVRKLGHD